MFWHGHRALVRMTHGRLGLWRPKADRWGALWLTTTGRRSGRSRQVLVGYFEDGEKFVTMAMNGWGASEPAWWLNLQARPDATVRTRDGVWQVRAHRAAGAERERLWGRWREIDKHLDAYAARRPTETAVVVFEPTTPAGQPIHPLPVRPRVREQKVPDDVARRTSDERWCVVHRCYGRRAAGTPHAVMRPRARRSLPTSDRTWCWSRSRRWTRRTLAA